VSRPFILLIKTDPGLKFCEKEFIRQEFSNLSIYAIP
jgi:hypothetical protein